MSEQEYDIQYQYGAVSSICESKDGYVRCVDVQYKNHDENNRRVTQHGVQGIVLIHPIDELDIYLS